MFANRVRNPLDYRVVVRQHFKPLVKNAELPAIRPYDLRHTHATLLVRKAKHPTIVAERLGHASTQVAMDVYSHVLPQAQQSAAEKMEELLEALLIG